MNKVTKTATGNTIRKPFHMLGNVVANYAAAVAAVGFTLSSHPVINPLTSKPMKQEVGVFRSDTSECLGIHSPNFTYLQPADSLQVLETARQQVGAEWASVHVGKGGRTLSGFVTLDTCITAPKRGDKVGLSIAYFDSFDGTGRARLQLCANVLACDNGMVSSKALVSFGSRHVPSLTDRLAVFQGSLAMNLQLQIDDMRHTIAALDNKGMTLPEVESFARQLFKVEATAKPENIPAQMQTRLEAVIQGFTRGTGNVGRTRWDAFNAVTEHLDHGGAYRTTEFSQADNRFESLLMGNAANVRERALELLLN